MGIKQSAYWFCLVLALAVCGCPKNQDNPVTEQSYDESALIVTLERKGALMKRMDSSLEIKVTGTAAPYKGRFFGTLAMEQEEGQLELWLQTYSVIGVPVLEVITHGDRIQIFSPLERTVYVNFTEYGNCDGEFPLSSFSEAALPVDLILEQVGLLWGKGFSYRFRYQLSEVGELYLLSEWLGDRLRREMYYTRPELDLVEVKLYRGDGLSGGVKFEDYSEADKNISMPRRIRLRQEEVEVALELSQIRVNDKVTGSGIAFRGPGEARIVLLTPPVP